jgi:hypothetical protein
LHRSAAPGLLERFGRSDPMHDPRHATERIETSGQRWRVTTANGDQFTCRILGGGPHLEVQLTAGEDDVVCAEVVSSFDAAGRLANRWLRTVIAHNDAEAGFPSSPSEFAC